MTKLIKQLLFKAMHINIVLRQYTMFSGIILHLYTTNKIYACVCVDGMNVCG